jgi:PilZ domain-containing protein
MHGITAARTAGGPGFDVALTSSDPEIRRGVTRRTPTNGVQFGSTPLYPVWHASRNGPRMANNQTTTMTVEDQNNGIEVTADIQCLLNDLNIDALIASLENAPEPQPAASPAVIPDDRSPRRFTPNELAADLKVTMPNVTDLAVVDISETGVLIETRQRLNPGTPADILVHLDGKRHTTRATVIRSNLHAIKPVVYRAALRFEKGLPIEARP